VAGLAAQPVPCHLRPGQCRGLADADRVVPDRRGDRRAGAVAGPPLVADDLRARGGVFRLDRDRLLRLADARHALFLAVATVFTLQAVLLVVAGIVRRDLVIRPRWDLASGLGAVFISSALIGAGALDVSW
jgi:hypothetical protein